MCLAGALHASEDRMTGEQPRSVTPVLRPQVESSGAVPSLHTPHGGAGVPQAHRKLPLGLQGPRMRLGVSHDVVPDTRPSHISRPESSALPFSTGAAFLSEEPSFRVN